MYSNSNYYDDDDDDDSMGNINVFNSTLTTFNNIKTQQNSCAICGAKPTGINFDVLTCSSCKAFFRRNGIKPIHHFICRSNGECKINERSRRQCTACRLQKCFAMGMIKERIRTEEQNKRHRALVEENRQRKLKKYQERRPEKNRLKQFDECRSQTICSTSSSSSCLLSNTSFNDIDLIFDLFLETTQEIIPKNFHFEFNIDLTNVLNSYCIPISCLITFLKQIFQFQQLPVDDRLLLLKTNVKILLPILTNLLNTTLNIPIIVNHPGLFHINNKITYAYSLFAHIIPDDNKLLTIILLVFLFCPCLFINNSLYDAGYINEKSRQSIRYAYDEYTHDLWIYIMEKSLDNEQQAILLYTKIVTQFLHLQNIMNEIYDIIEDSVEIDRLHIMMQSILHLT